MFSATFVRDVLEKDFMDVRIENTKDVIIVHLFGYLDVESPTFFNLLRQPKIFNGRKVLLNFAELYFVGSSGMTAFFAALRDFKQLGLFPLEVCGLKPEFTCMILKPEPTPATTTTTTATMTATATNEMPPPRLEILLDRGF
jgi:anti-anti-sigma regulatory factor